MSAPWRLAWMGGVTVALATLVVADEAQPTVGTSGAPADAREVRVRLALTLDGAPRGAGLVLLNTRLTWVEATLADLDWSEPNVKGCLGIGFDTHNPPNEDPFNADGNIYDRPQREVSIHWDGIEVANALSTVDFADGQPHEALLRIEFQAAAAEVSVSIDGTPVHERVLVPGLLPYPMGHACAIETDDPQGTVEVRELTGRGRAPQTRPAEHCHAIEGAVLDAGHQQEEATVALPPSGKPYARVLLWLSLRTPPDGIDPWDRAGSVYVWSDSGERFEILRFITPFGREVTWQADVTDYQSLLRGSRKVGVAIGTWVKGWAVDVCLDYYAGKPARYAHRVTNLWSGDLEYGNPADPLESHLPTREVKLAPGTRSATVRAVVTGHGMNPNTDNAAEFMSAGRTLTVNGTRFENVLWRADCYLNPCRPQGGTWKYDRAGWCPGALVQPWDTDVTSLAKAGRSLTLEYNPQPYTNANAGRSRASHLVEAQLIEYR
ncbi:MAG: hypothetical protein FJX74_07575 [Armatimonadetes bacterium]|nr:hypothetical protein [Armatimonadota bacterium]